MSDISRQAYADMFGPTTGDKVRWRTPNCGSRSKTISPPTAKRSSSAAARSSVTVWAGQMLADDCVDLVLTNALIVDHWGSLKPISASKTGGSPAIGKAGNPDIQPGVNIPIGAATEVIAAEGKIVTAGGVDTISTGSVRSRRKRRWSPASPPWSAAAPARPRGRMPLPARRARGTSRGCCRRQQSAGEYRSVGQRQRLEPGHATRTGRGRRYRPENS